MLDKSRVSSNLNTWVGPSYSTKDQKTHAMFITALVIATPATALLYQALVYLTETYL